MPTVTMASFKAAVTTAVQQTEGAIRRHPGLALATCNAICARAIMKRLPQTYPNSIRDIVMDNYAPLFEARLEQHRCR